MRKSTEGDERQALSLGKQEDAIKEAFPGLNIIDWVKENGANKFVIGVLKENHKARKVYEKWGGKLSSHTQNFIKLGVGYKEVFYTYEIK